MCFYPVFSYVKRDLGHYNNPLGYGFSEKNSIDYIKNNYASKKTFLICADNRTPQYLEFYFSMKPPKNLKILQFEDIKRYAINDFMSSDVLVYINAHTNQFLKKYLHKK